MSKDLTEALRALTEESGGAPAKPLPLRGAAVAVKSAAALSTAKASGGGLASPLTETSYASRQYHDSRLYTSSDGMITIERLPIKSLSFVDANGDVALLVFKAPT